MLSRFLSSIASSVLTTRLCTFPVPAQTLCLHHTTVNGLNIWSSSQWRISSGICIARRLPGRRGGKMPTLESTSQESGYQNGRRSAASAHLAKPAANLSHPQRIVSYVTTTPRSSSNSLDVAQAQVEPEIPTNPATDDRSGKAVAAIKRSRLLHRSNLSPPFRQPDGAPSPRRCKTGSRSAR
jgi:hypothetical protein